MLSKKKGENQFQRRAEVRQWQMLSNEAVNRIFIKNVAHIQLKN